MSLTVNDYRKHGMVKIAILGKLQSPPRLVPDFIPEDHGNNQIFCIENGTQIRRHRSPMEKFQPVPVAYKERQRGDRWSPLFLKDTQ